MGELKNKKDERFALEYIKHYDAKAAALAAGYAYSTARNAAAWIHPEHPTKKALKQRIDELIAEDFARLGVTPERIRMELARIAFANVSEVIDQKKLELRPDADKNDLAAVSSISIKRGKVKGLDVRMCDKLTALKLLQEYYGLPGKRRQDGDDADRVVKVELGELEEYAK